MQTAERRKASLDRMRATRERRRAGYVGMISVPLHENEVASLIRHDFLTEQDRDDREALSEALGALLDYTLNARPDEM
jgi:hypothetical protein